MKFLGGKFNHLLRPIPPPPGEGPESAVEANHTRFDKRPRSGRRRSNELRPNLPPVLDVADDQVGESTTEQIMNFLTAERPDLARLLQEELNGSRQRGTEDLRGAVGRVRLRKASEGLNGRHSMSRLAAAGQLLVTLPVPPHLEDWAFERVDQEMVFVVEEHLPPHLEEAELPFLDDLLPHEVQKNFENVRGILAEGQIRGGAVITRRSVVRVIQLLPKAQVTLFLHHMPHRPPHAEFARVDNVEVVEI